MDEWLNFLGALTPAAIYLGLGFWFYVPYSVRRDLQARFDAYGEDKEPNALEVEHWRDIAFNKAIGFLIIWPLVLTYRHLFFPLLDKFSKAVFARTVSDGEYDWKQRREIERLDKELAEVERQKRLGQIEIAREQVARQQGLPPPPPSLEMMQAEQDKINDMRLCDCSQRGWHRHPGREDLWFYNKHDF